MHILAGRFRGKKLLSPLGQLSRPTLSRIRQSLFNILAPDLAHASFLDLYAGAGSIGLEAFSQGCARVMLVESDPAVAQALRKNALSLDPGQKQVEVFPGDARTIATRLARQKTVFDFVFLDPPYGGECLAPWQADGVLAGLLAPGGRLILQHGRRDPVPADWAGLQKTQTRAYGETTLSFFEHGERL
jgi:16S rRNA (guanine966-N2)-methyltransferase